MSQPTHLSERLERLGKKLMATTEFSKDAHAVLEAAIALGADLPDTMNWKCPDCDNYMMMLFSKDEAVQS